MPLPIGTTLLDKYRLEALLGQGAFGEVYRVTHLKLGVTRAVKILRADAPGLGLQGFEDARNRFQLEAHLGAQLNTTAHPHLIPVYAVEEDQGMLLLEMEYEPGGSLADRLAQYKRENRLMPVDEALRITREIAAGLAVIHQHDIVHRDLKPSNILFDAQGRAKIADLGLAQVPGGMSMRSQLSQPMSHPGTAAYMSPEQQNSGGYLTSASDIYTVGLMLFEMLTGRNYKNLPPGTRVKSVRPEVPGWIDALLVKMLAHEPKERPWNGQALQAQVSVPEKGPRSPFVVGKAGIGFGAGGMLIVAVVIFALLQNNSPNLPTPTVQPTIPANISVVTTDNMSAPILTNTPASAPSPLPTEKPTLQPALPTSTQAPENTPTLAPPSTPTLSVPTLGSTQISPVDEMVMLYIPAGEFLMGASTNNLTTLLDLCPSCSADTVQDQTPQRQINLDAFWMDRTEVTNAQFEKFVAATGHRTTAEQDGSSWVYTFSGNSWKEVSGANWMHPTGSGSDILGLEDYPVVQVSWDDALAYCLWAERDLPTEAQWEKAARGSEGNLFPWGEQPPTNTLLNYNNTVNGTSAVGNYPNGVSPYGLLDMAGNVWEWLADFYQEDYYNQMPAQNPTGPTTGTKHLKRGGSWGTLKSTELLYVTSTFRLADRPDKATNTAGFRCVANP